MPITLKTGLSAPLRELEQGVLSRCADIESWFRRQWAQTPPPIYGSVDLRNAGFKLVPVDMNLFPAGFNNLERHSAMPLAVQAAQQAIVQRHPECRRILLIPENHTRNLYYLESLHRLQEILTCAGYETRIGSLIPDLIKAQDIALPSGHRIRLEPLRRDGKRVGLDKFDPCLLLLNNDLSDGFPEQLADIEQPIYPTGGLGWDKRLKSDHFAHYQNTARAFARQFDIDPWLITPEFRHCGQINFLKREGEECVLRHAGALFAQIKREYAKRGIEEPPYIVVKADAGTYGMGVMAVGDLEQLQALNRKARGKMSASKGGQPVSQVILQEGVHSFEYWQEHIAEPVAYLIDRHIIGGFYRVHKDKGPSDNLNAPGMRFEPVPFNHPCNLPDCRLPPATEKNRFYLYGVVARLSMLAAAKEKAEAGRTTED